MKITYHFVLTIIVAICFQSCLSTITFEEIISERLADGKKSIHLSYIVANFKDSQKVESVLDEKACSLNDLYDEYDAVLITFYRKSMFTNLPRLEKNTDNLAYSIQNDYLWTYHFRNGEYRFKLNHSFKIRNKDNICQKK